MPRVLTLPGAPILLFGVGGEQDPGADLRGHCLTAVDELLGDLPDEVGRVLVVAAGPTTAAWNSDQPYDIGRLIGRDRAAAPGPGASLPLGLAIGRELLRTAGWDGPLLLQSVDAAAPVEACAGLATSLAVGAGDLVVAIGDGSVLRRPLGPGPVHSQADVFDRSVQRAWADGDRDAIAGIDLDLAAVLQVTGRAPWQVAAAASGAVSRARVHYADDPFGIFHLIASWR